MTQTTLETARALFENIEAGNPEGVAALYTDDVEVWHNFSNKTQSKQENLQTLTGLIQSVETVWYEVKELLTLAEDRVLQRHDLHCHLASGEHFTIPACIFITVQAGKISRIEEYLDSAQANALRAASGRTALGD